MIQMPESNFWMPMSVPAICELMGPVMVPVLRPPIWRSRPLAVKKTLPADAPKPGKFRLANGDAAAEAPAAEQEGA